MIASIIVGGLYSVLVGVLPCASPKPGLAFVIQFPSLKNVEGDAVAATSKRFRARADAERDLEWLSKIWLVNSGESPG